MHIQQPVFGRACSLSLSPQMDWSVIRVLLLSPFLKSLPALRANLHNVVKSIPHKDSEDVESFLCSFRYPAEDDFLFVRTYRAH